MDHSRPNRKARFMNPLSQCFPRRRSGYGEIRCFSANRSFVTDNVSVCDPPSRQWLGLDKCYGFVPACDGRCYGLGLRKCLSDKVCDGVTAQNPGGCGATTYSRQPLRVIAVVRGQHLLLDKVEKNRISPKTWYWAVFQIGKFEMAANQNDPAETERNRSLKFLQFLENFSGGDIYRGGATKVRTMKATPVAKASSVAPLGGAMEDRSAVVQTGKMARRAWRRPKSICLCFPPFSSNSKELNALCSPGQSNRVKPVWQNHRCHRIRGSSKGMATPSRCGIIRAV